MFEAETSDRLKPIVKLALTEELLSAFARERGENKPGTSNMTAKYIVRNNRRMFS